MDKKSIIENAIFLKTEEDPLVIRKTVCKFFKGIEGVGNDCDHSSTPELACGKDECVLDCKDTYLRGIFTKPQEFWTADWELPLQNTEAKKLSSESAFGLNCNNCYLSSNCFSFKANTMCSIDWGENDVATEPGLMLEELIKIQYKRIRRAEMIEQLDGGVPDQNLSSEMDRLTALVAQKNSLGDSRFSMSIEASGKNGGNLGGGILAQLFGKKEEKIEEIVTVHIPTSEPEFKEEYIIEKKDDKRKRPSKNAD